MILPRSTIISVLALGGTIAVVLIPKKGDLVDRLLNDGNTSRVLELVGPATAESFSKSITEYQISPNSESLSKLKAIISLTKNPEELFHLITNHKHLKFSDNHRSTVVNHLGKRALEMNQPETAVKVYQWHSDQGTLTLDELQSAIMSCRFNGQPEIALEMVESSLEKRKLPYEKLPQVLRYSYIRLKREANQGDEALALLKKEINSDETGKNQWDILDELTEVSLQTGQTGESVPFLKSFLVKTDAANLSLAELINRSETSDTDEKFIKYGKLLAQNYEWNAESEKAFDLYVKMAFLGESSALERAFTLYEWLQKYDQMADLLAAIPSESLSTERLIVQAKLDVKLTRYKSAEDRFTKLIERDDVERASIYIERAQLYDEQDKFDEAIHDYQMAVEIDDRNIKLLTQVPELYIAQGKHRQALETFRSIPLNKHTKESFESYQILAQTLESTDDIVTLLNYLCKNKETAKPQNYIDLHLELVKTGNRSAAIEAIENGYHHLPESPNLQLALAQTKRRQRDLDGALEILNKNHNLDDPRFLSQVIKLAAIPEYYDAAIELLNLTEERQNALPSSLKYDLAAVYETRKEWDLALSIYRITLGGETHIQRISAKKAYQEGDYKQTINLLEPYLSQESWPTPNLWMILGDSHKKVGNTKQANDAYQNAILQIEHEIL